MKKRSLSACATSVIFACKFDSETEIWFALVVKVAEALTGPPPVVAPVGVTKVKVSACAGGNVPIIRPAPMVNERTAPKDRGKSFMVGNLVGFSSASFATYTKRPARKMVHIE